MLLHLRRPWHDGTRAILFEPLELLEKLTALVARPRVNLLLYYGILGPAARARREALARTRAPSGLAQVGATGVNPGDQGRPTPDQIDDRTSPASTAVPATSTAVPRGATVGAIAGSATPTSALTQTAAPVEREQAPPIQGRNLPPSPPSERPRYYSWAQLMGRAFEVDVLPCACGGRPTPPGNDRQPGHHQENPCHFGLPTECPEPLPARSPPPAPEAQDHFQLDLLGS